MSVSGSPKLGIHPVLGTDWRAYPHSLLPCHIHILKPLTHPPPWPTRPQTWRRDKIHKRLEMEPFGGEISPLPRWALAWLERRESAVRGKRTILWAGMVVREGMDFCRGHVLPLYLPRSNMMLRRPDLQAHMRNKGGNLGLRMWSGPEDVILAPSCFCCLWTIRLP